MVDVRKAHDSVVRDWLASRSIPAVAMPACGPRRDRDFVHGNAAFGQVMTLEMARYLTAQSNGALVRRKRLLCDPGYSAID